MGFILSDNRAISILFLTVEESAIYGRHIAPAKPVASDTGFSDPLARQSASAS